MLSNVTPLIRKLTNKEDLTAKETQTAFETVIKEDTEGYYWLALTLGLHTKGETADKLYGFCMAHDTFATKLTTKVDQSYWIDISGTGGDKLNTFNIGTVTSFVLAAEGLVVPKQAARGWTSPTGSADIFADLGITALTLDKNTVERTYRNYRYMPLLLSWYDRQSQK